MALAGVKLEDLQQVGNVSVSEDHAAFSCFTIAQLPAGEFGLKTIGKKAAIDNNMTTAISNERWLWSTLKEKDLPSAVIPKLLATCCDVNALHMLISPPIGGGFTAVVENVSSIQAHKLIQIFTNTDYCLVAFCTWILTTTVLRRPSLGCGS
jgi:hypothetical protein